MVGVKGKYKGCNTCRKRRVACDNTRPYCKKCTDHGRNCEGYQTETIFIVGTIEDKGRCASHPPRNLESPGTSSSLRKKKAVDTVTLSPGPEPARSRRRAASEGQQEDVKIEFKEVLPTRSRSEDPVLVAQSSWQDFIDVASVGGLHRLRFAAIHTRLKSVKRQHERLGDSEMKLSLHTSRRVDVTPTYSDENLKLEAECFIYLPRRSRQSSQAHSWDANAEEGLCLFLYEIFAAILNHSPTHMSDPEWNTTPWEHSPKMPLDTLLDIIVKLPLLLSRSDRIVSLPSSLQRQLQALDLIKNCTTIEAQFESWYSALEEAALRNVECPLLYWAWRRAVSTIESEPWSHGQVPFEVTYDFPCAGIGLSHIYYWTGLIVLYRIMNRLLAVAENDNPFGGSLVAATVPMPAVPATAGPVNIPALYLTSQLPEYVYDSPADSVHSYTSASGSADDRSSLPTAASFPYQTSPDSSYHPSSSPHIPSASLVTDDVPPNTGHVKYRPREIRQLAANVCRSLDWAIRRFEGDALGPLCQPDLVAAPLYIIERYYEDIAAVGDGELERMWCTVFRERWEQRASEIESAIFGPQENTTAAVPGSAVGTEENGVGKRWIGLGRFGA
ncbi:hypothetical protein TruAng_003612 [Truncatella angustata]|nr:hypothetical protein TruAng_003612 [Truncatella angustata]